MSQIDRLKADFQNCAGPFPYTKLVTLLTRIGYELKRRNGGSGRCFVNKHTGSLILLHEPHPGNEVKYYAVKQIKALLAKRGEL